MKDNVRVKVSVLAEDIAYLDLLRDYFAAAAMMSGISGTDEDAARIAYKIADAMLAERSKQRP